MSRSLTPKQQAFVDEYQRDRNATQAAIRAGYSPKTAQPASSRLLSNVMVQQALAEAREVRVESIETDRQWVLDGLRREATAGDMQKPSSVRVRATELIGREFGMFADSSGSEVIKAFILDLIHGLEPFFREGHEDLIKQVCRGTIAAHFPDIWR